MKYLITMSLFCNIILVTIANGQSYTYTSEGFESATWSAPATSYAAATGTWTTSASTVVSSPTSPNTSNGGTKCLSIPSGQFLTSPTLNNGVAILSFYARSTSTTARTITVLTSTDGISFTTFTTVNSSSSSISYLLITIPINNIGIKNIRIVYPAGGGGAIDDISMSAVTPTSFYNALNSDVSNLNNWWSNTDGLTGSHPINFTNTGQVFNITHAGAFMTSSWTVSSISFSGSNTLTLGANTLKINGSVSGAGSLNGSNSSSMIISGAAGIINFTTGGQVLKDLTLNTNATATLGTSLAITGGSAFGTLTCASGSTLTTGNNLTLRSAIDGTARIGQSSGTISGNVTVERFIPANSTRAWRLLSVPVATPQSFHLSWQENLGAAVIGTAGLGVNITSSRSTWATDGFDYHSNGDALLSWNGAINSGAGGWVGVTSTSNAISTDYGYMLYMRGDRNATPSNNSITATTLRTNGSLKQGAYPVTPITVPSSQYSLIGNPYVSQIDFRNVTKGAGIDNTFYVWDPKLTGANGLGAFQSMSYDGSNYLISPGGGSYGVNGSSMNTIESGEAFFIHCTTADNISFTEGAKTAGNNMVFSPSAISEKLAVNLYTVTPGTNLVDGSLVLYDNNFSDSVTAEDAGKLSNFGITLSMTRQSQALAIEKRKLIISSDTIFLNMSGLIQQQYLLELIATNLDHPALFGYLQDRYIGTFTSLHLNGNTSYSFTVDSNPGSSAPDRFVVIFSPISTLPLQFTGIDAIPQNGSVLIRWKTATNTNLLNYDIERSEDGFTFYKIGSLSTVRNNQGIYEWRDERPLAGTNYYRVKGKSANGEIEYTRIVRVSLDLLVNGIRAFPNPVTDGRIHLRLDVPGGKYCVSMTDHSGKEVYTEQIQYRGVGIYIISPASRLPHGVYQVQLSNPTGDKWKTQIIY